MTRLETAMARPGHGIGGIRGGEVDRDLAERHAQLKSAAAQALAGIDALLARNG